jgi:CheY-like chemotaxis protein
MLRKISETAQRGRRFTQEVLGMAAQVGEEDVKAVSLHERINGVLALLQNQLGRGYTVATELNAEHDLVLGPPGILHQAVFNLLSNGIQSMPNGGTLTVETTTLPKETGEPERIHLHIHDTGDRPLNRKNPVDPSRRTIMEQDLGPKLASVLGMIARLDGSLKVASDPDAGTAVDLLLPICLDPDADMPVREVRRRLAPSRIWVVDDDPVVRDMCSRVLSEEGHTVAVVDTGDDLRKRLEGSADEPPELLIYDFSMPDVPGRELVSWLRDEQQSRTPVLLVSGFHPDHPDIQASLKFRKTFLLNKPFTFRDMADQVTVALGETLIGE